MTWANTARLNEKGLWRGSPDRSIELGTFRGIGLRSSSHPHTAFWGYETISLFGMKVVASYLDWLSYVAWADVVGHARRLCSVRYTIGRNVANAPSNLVSQARYLDLTCADTQCWPLTSIIGS